MDYLTSFPGVIKNSFDAVWFKIVSILPEIIGAIVIFVIGLFIADGVGRLVAKVLNRIYLDKAAEKSGTKHLLEKVGFKTALSKALGLLVTWFLYAVFLIAIADVLGLPQITEFLKTVVAYLPNVIVAVVIMVVGLMVANFLAQVVKKTAEANKVPNASVVAAIAKWSVLIMTVMAALTHLQIAERLIEILFAGLVLMISLAGGLAFGLGGKEKAAEILRKCCGNGKS